MGETPRWRLEQCCSLLRVLSRKVHLDPRLRRRFDSSDIVQEALLRVHRDLAAFRGTTEAELVAWLHKILAHTVIDKVREAHAQKQDVDLEQSLQGMLTASSARLEAFLADKEGQSPSESAERREFLERLSNAIEQLPDDQRDVVILRDLMQTPVKEIAGRLGKTPKSVAGLLERGRSQLRKLLADQT
jgi:RNA polymerase sigma-70 factor (ECF subfamily)